MKSLIISFLIICSNSAFGIDFEAFIAKFDQLFIGVLIEDKSTGLERLYIKDIIVGDVNQERLVQANDTAIHMEKVNKEYRTSKTFVFGIYKNSKNKISAYVDKNGILSLNHEKENIKLSLDEVYRRRRK